MNEVEVSWRPDWTLRDYVDLVPNRPLDGRGFVAYCHDAEVCRLWNLDAPVAKMSTERASLLVESARGECWRVRFT